MAILNVPDQHIRNTNFAEIKAYLKDRNIFLDQSDLYQKLSVDAQAEEILQILDPFLKPYMDQHGYKVADVIVIDSHTPNLDAVRAKFLAEHTHTEDEVRYFVAGQGHFWFNPGGGNAVFNVLCQAGDLISVPANTPHWFDAGETNPYVKAVRMFTDMSGWVPHYVNRS